MSVRQAKLKKKGGKAKNQIGAEEIEVAAQAPKTIQIHEHEVVVLPPRPAPRRLTGMLKRTGDQPEGEQAPKKLKATFPKSQEVIGIDVDNA